MLNAVNQKKKDLISLTSSWRRKSNVVKERESD